MQHLYFEKLDVWNSSGFTRVIFTIEVQEILVYILFLYQKFGESSRVNRWFSTCEASGAGVKMYKARGVTGFAALIVGGDLGVQDLQKTHRNSLEKS